MTKSWANQVKWSPKQREGKRKTISAQNTQETWAKEKSNESPKKMKRDKVQDMDSNLGYSQAWEAIENKFSMKCNP